jgi:type I restriction enzyme S subunit
LINETVTRGLDKSVPMKDSGIEWIGEVPIHWKVKHFKQFATMKGRIGWQGLKHSEFIDEGPFLITGMNFKDGKIRWNEVYHITEERYQQAPEIQLRENDVLMTKDGTIGKLLYVDTIPAPHKASLNSHLLVFRPVRNSYSPRYLYYQLDSYVFKNYVEIAKTGTTFFGISQAAVGRYIAILPPLDEQKAIADYLDTKTAQIDQIIQTINAQIEKLKELRKTLINDVVTGKIKVIE